MSITFRAATGLVASTDTAAPYADVTFTLPTGHTTDDLLIALAGWKHYDTTQGVPTGFASEIGPITSGTTASTGADIGSVAAQVWTKTHDGSETDPTATRSAGTTPHCASMVALYKSNAGAWTVDSTSGTSETTTLNVSGAGSLAWAAGDKAVVFVHHRVGPETHTSPALTASGVTFTNLTQQLATTTTNNGNDASSFVYTADVTVGATAAPNFTATLSASDGWVSVIFLRIAEPGVTAATPAVVTAAGSVGSPAISNTGTHTGSVVTGAGSVGAPTISNSSTTTAVVVTAAGSVGAPTISLATVVTATVVTGSGSVGAPTITNSSTHTATIVTAGSSVRDPAITNSSTHTATVITVAGSVGSPTIESGSSGEHTATVVTAAGSVGSPTITNSSNHNAVRVSAGGSVPNPTITNSSTHTATVVTGTSSVGTTTIANESTHTAAVVTGTGSVGSPSLLTEVFHTATVVTGTGTVGTPTIEASNFFTHEATTVTGTGQVLTPALFIASYRPVSARRPDRTLAGRRPDRTLSGRH